MDNHDASEHDKEMREQLHKMDGKFQGLANGIYSIKNAISETQEIMRGEPAYEVDKNEMRIVLLGTAAGKNSSGNTLLGKHVFSTGMSLKSTTLKCKLEKAKRFGKTLLVVDTPGSYSHDMPFTQTDEEIRKCIMMTSPGPHTFLFVVSVGRFTLEQNEMFENYVKLFSEELYKYAIVLFTMKDDLENDGISAEKYLENINISLTNILEKCGNRYVFFNNRASQENWDEYAKELLDMIDRMLIANGNSYYTS